MGQVEGSKGVTMKITSDKVVELEYVLRVGGEVVDQSEPGEPLVYLHGHNNIIPGLERALEGKSVGDSMSVTVPPEEGYGERDEENVQVLPREDFEDDVEVGASYFAQSEDGSITPLTVVEVLPEGVKVDFNPPLAGETLDFQVTVKGIRDASAEELEHGHAHDGSEDDEE
jgi:FKBP-type peptidyl-prolyl cis-trans isomerase SlyD